MKITVQSPHFTVSYMLNKYVTDKVNKLATYNSRILRCEVCLKLDKSDTDLNKVCEIKVIAPEKNLFASTKGLTFEEAVNLTVNAIEKQITKRKTKRNGNNDIIEMHEHASAIED